MRPGTWGPVLFQPRIRELRNIPTGGLITLAFALAMASSGPAFAQATPADTKQAPADANAGPVAVSADEPVGSEVIVTATGTREPQFLSLLGVGVVRIRETGSADAISTPNG